MESSGSTPLEQLAAALRSEPGLPENVRIAIQQVLSKAGGQPAGMDEAPTEVGTGGVAAPDLMAAAPMAEGPGTRIGRYKLLQLIGEGGFGSVFMAEQNHPVKRRVALKIIKLGMDTRQVVARFEAERQALAMMEHPNIARVLDAGSTDTGRPYFVMELVKGVPIIEFCDREKLSARKRLELFVCVCNAVQHAHQKGIIHRDLKPTNILVTIADGVPIPKVIDFGIAKATTGQLTDKTLYTEIRQLIGTPEYMSPEQAEMSGVDIDTRSDIYSMGVLLYQLLTGTTPFDANELRTHGHAEIQRLIREVEPPSPSTRLTTMNQEVLANIARQRQVEPEKLRRLLKGELDWIVMKCLEKDRTRRYETANGLAKDVQRYLNDETIIARPASRVYRVKKFTRKHKAETIGVLSVLAALLLALAGISIGLVQARLNLDAARHAEQRAQASETQVIADRDRLAESERRARQSEQIARQQRAVAREECYLSKVALLDHLTASGSAEDQDAELLGCPAEYRGWEWGHLALLSQSAGAFTLPVANPTGIQFLGHSGRLAVRDNGGLVTIWDLARGRADGVIGTPADPVQEFASTSDARLLALTRRGGRISIFDVSNRLELWTLPQHPDSGYFLPARHWLVTTAHHPNSMVVWDVESRREIFSLSIAADAKSWSWTASETEPGRISVGVAGGPWQIWDVQTKTLQRTIKAPPGKFSVATFGPDARFLVPTRCINWNDLLTVSEDGRVLGVWDALTGRQRCAITMPGTVRRAIFMDGGKRLWSLDSTGISTWEIPSGRQISYETLQVDYGFGVSGLTKHAELIIQNGLPFPLRIWDADGTVCLRTRQVYGGGCFPDFSPDERLLASPDGPNGVRIWDTLPGRTLANAGFGVSALAYNSDGTLLACAGSGRRIKIFDARGGGLRLALDGHWRDVRALAFSPDGNLLLSGGEDTLLKLWNAQDGQELLTIRAGPPVQCVAFGPRGRIACGGGGYTQVFDAASGKRLLTLPGDTGPVSAVAFSPDRQTLAASGLGNTVVLWNSTGEPLRILRGHLEHVSSLVFSRDGTLLASGARDDSTIRIWDVRSGTLLRAYGGHPRLAAVSFSPDNRRLAVIGAGNVELVDRDNGRSVLTLPRPQGGPYHTVSFSPDGLTLAGAGADGIVQQWGALPWSTASNTPAQPAPPQSAGVEDRARLQTVRNAYWRQRLADSTLPATVEPGPWKPEPSAWPARDPEASADSIDLSDLYSAPLNLPCASRSGLWHLQPGVVRLDGVPFDVRGIVQLQTPRAGSDPLFPSRIAIPIGKPAARLHFLHATFSSASVGDVVGRYVVHYADGGQQVIDLTYGRELRIWNDTGEAYNPLHPVWIAAGPLRPAWIAPDESLYHLCWDNPTPDRPIAGVDFIGQGTAGPLLVALTIDPPQDQLQSRLAVLDQQINGKSTTGSLLMERARTQMLLGHIGPAITDDDAALRLREDDDARGEYARALAADKQFDKAEKQYLLLIERARASFQNGGSWADLGAIEPAVEAFYVTWGRPERAYQIRREFQWLWDKRDAEGQIQQRTQVLRFDPDNEAALVDRGLAHASLWQFREAADDFDHLRRINPDNHLYWHEGIPPLLEIGQEDQYRELRGRALRTAAFANSPDWNVPHRIAKDAMFIPLGGQDLKLAMAFSDRAMGLATNGFTWQTKGMAEYRAGNFQEAIAWLDRSVADVESMAVAPYFVIPDRLFLAMAYQRVGEQQQARYQLQAASN